MSSLSHEFQGFLESMIRQRTLKNVIRATGVGLHTGRKIRLTLSPAPVDHGIVFRRIDLDPPVAIKAHAEMVGDTTLSTSLGTGDVRVSTVEHLLSPGVFGQGMIRQRSNTQECDSCDWRWLAHWSVILLGSCLECPAYPTNSRGFWKV